VDALFDAHFGQLLPQAAPDGLCYWFGEQQRGSGPLA
jgi:hypothetical protein